MNNVHEYISNLENQNQHEIMERLHKFFMTIPHVSCELKYRVPFYRFQGLLCYMNPLKKDAVELCFLRGHELSNQRGLLQKKNRKIVAGVTLESPKGIPIEEIAEIFHEAIFLDGEYQKEKSAARKKSQKKSFNRKG